MKRILLVIAFLLLANLVYAQQQNFDNVEIKVLPVQGNVYMLVGAGGNITLQVSDQGVLLVDTQFAQLSNKIIAAIRKISDRPIRYIINTHYHGDHTGGNENIARIGTTLNVGPGANLQRPTATIIAHINVLNRMSAPTGEQAPTPSAAWPTDTYLTAQKELFFNDEPIEIIHVPAAHTDGDSIVFFRKSDVVSAGDVFVTTSYPYFDVQAGGTINGVIDALNRIIHIAIPKHEQEGGTYIIPGHGRLCDEHDIVEYRDMVTIIRDRVQTLIKKGMTLEQVKAARPTKEYDRRYGSTTGPRTTDMFVESVYNTLSAKK
jgi:glyoxylase-like metal-dependent hydrolase (beta-lactamase superfamily II)